MRIDVWTIDFVDYNDWSQAFFESFAQYETCLRHWTFAGVNDQQCAINHSQNAFDFATKVCVARCVDDVDEHVFISDSRVFRKNCDTTLTLEVVRVHYAFDDFLIVAEYAGLTKESINQCCFAVVDVRDDRDVADMSEAALMLSEMCNFCLLAG